MLNTTDKIIKHKTGLLNLAEELGNVSKARQVMGYSRDTFYRYKSAVEDGGALQFRQAARELGRRAPVELRLVDAADHHDRLDPRAAERREAGRGGRGEDERGHPREATSSACSA